MWCLCCTVALDLLMHKSRMVSELFAVQLYNQLVYESDMANMSCDTRTIHVNNGVNIAGSSFLRC